MKFTVLTLFPEMIEQSVTHSIMKRAIENKIIEVEALNIREFTINKHKKVDDYPYGGGCGMVMQVEPIYNCYKSVEKKLSKNKKVIYMSPKGKPLTQKIVEELGYVDDIVILCGHYEGVDQRIIDEIITDEISIGDYVLTGGELPALVLMDSVARLIDGVISKEESHQKESFSNGLLEYPQYSRPKEILGREVPAVLLSGNHKKIEVWRHEQSLKITKKNRPDLIKKK